MQITYFNIVLSFLWTLKDDWYIKYNCQDEDKRLRFVELLENVEISDGAPVELINEVGDFLYSNPL